MNPVPEPPPHLSERSTAFWQAVVSTYVVDDAASVELLRRACEASDRADEARAVLDRDGLVVTTRLGELRAHPCVAVERDSRNAVRQLLRELRITDGPPEDRHSSRLGGRR